MNWWLSSGTHMSILLLPIVRASSSSKVFIMDKSWRRDSFPFHLSNVLIFPGNTNFEEWIYGYNFGHNIHEVPLHTLVMIQNLFYKDKVHISLWLQKEMHWSFIVEGIYIYRSSILLNTHKIMRDQVNWTCIKLSHRFWGFFLICVHFFHTCSLASGI